MIPWKLAQVSLCLKPGRRGFLKVNSQNVSTHETLTKLVSKTDLLGHSPTTFCALKEATLVILQREILCGEGTVRDGHFLPSEPRPSPTKMG
jgi:hypothetical protein